MVREVVNSVILIVSDDLKRAYGWTGIEDLQLPLQSAAVFHGTLLNSLREGCKKSNNSERLDVGL